MVEINAPFAEVALVHISIYLHKVFVCEREDQKETVKSLIYKIIIFYCFMFFHFIIFKSCSPCEKQG